MNLITSIDFLGNEPKMYIFKKDIFKTLFGGFLSILTAIAILSLSLYFIILTFSRQDLDLISSQTTRFEKRLILSSIPILFSPANKDGVLFNTSMVYPVIQYWNFPPKSQGVVNVTTVPFKQCDMNDVKGYEDLFTGFHLNSFYCMNKSTLNLTLSGDNGDINNGYAKLNVYIAECRNDSIYNPNPNRQGCLPKDKIDATLSTFPIILYMTFPDYEINFQNLTNPYMPYIRTENFIFAAQAKNSYLYYLKRTFITTDYGFVFESDDTIFSYQSDSMLSMSSLGSAFFVPEAFGVFQLALASRADLYFRSYTKLQTLIANISGIADFIIILAKLIIDYVSDKSLLLQYINYRSNSRHLSESKKKNTGQLVAYNVITTENNSAGMTSLHNVDMTKFAKKEPLELTLKEIILPRIFSSRYKDIFHKIEEYVKHKLSLDNILRESDEFERVKRYLFNSHELYVFENLDRMTCRILNCKLDERFDYEKFKTCLQHIGTNPKFIDMIG
jgi:hypothetical protein